MKTKNTILSQKDLSVLENVLLKTGKIASFDDLKEAFEAGYSYAEIKNRVSHLAQAGWLVRLKRGLYVVITDISTLGFNDLNPYVLSQALNKNSYISFESALQHYQMFDQMVRRIDAVTDTVAHSYTVENITYKFSQIKKACSFGFTPVPIGTYVVNIAEKEKAILDMLYFRTSGYTISLVLEKLLEYKHEFDFAKLSLYAERFGTSMIRKVGFLLDLLAIDTQRLSTRAEVKANSYSKLTNSTQQFNAKWRLYYDPAIINED